jgi:hypothetical protein
MGYRFPPEHEQCVTFSRDELPTEPRSKRGPEVAGWGAAALSTAGEERKSQPSFAEIDVVEADLSLDPRFERV